MSELVYKRRKKIHIDDTNLLPKSFVLDNKASARRIYVSDLMTGVYEENINTHEVLYYDKYIEYEILIYHSTERHLFEAVVVVFSENNRMVDSFGSTDAMYEAPKKVAEIADRAFHNKYLIFEIKSIFNQEDKNLQYLKNFGVI